MVENLLAQWACYKGLSVWVQSRLDPCPNDDDDDVIHRQVLFPPFSFRGCKSHPECENSPLLRSRRMRMQLRMREFEGCMSICDWLWHCVVVVSEY